MNTVEIDRAALEAEADAAVVDVPQDTDAAAANAGSDAEGAGGAGDAPPAELTMQQLEQIARGYEPAAFVLVARSCDIICPAWAVTQDERRGLAQSIALALAAWFPDAQLPPKYAALLGVAGSLFAIVEARRDPATGDLRPRKVSHDDAQQPLAFGAAAGGAFTTATA